MAIINDKLLFVTCAEYNCFTPYREMLTYMLLLLCLQEDPALTRWVFARTNPYNHFRATKKTSLLGGLFGVVPLFVLYYVLKTDRVWMR
jgi:hypothetical protein